MYAFMLYNVTNPLIICMYMYRTRIQRLAAVKVALGPCTYQDGTGNQLIQGKICSYATKPLMPLQAAHIYIYVASTTI